MRTRKAWQLLAGSLVGGLTLASWPLAALPLGAQQPAPGGVIQFRPAARAAARRPISEATPQTLLQGLPPYDAHPSQQKHFVAPPAWSAQGKLDPTDPAPAPPSSAYPQPAPVSYYLGDEEIPQPPLRLEPENPWPVFQEQPPAAAALNRAAAEWSVPRQYRYLADPRGELEAGRLVEQRLEQGLAARRPADPQDLSRWAQLNNPADSETLREPSPRVAERLEQAAESRTTEEASLDGVKEHAEARRTAEDWQANADRLEAARKRLEARTPDPQTAAVAHSRGMPAWLPQNSEEKLLAASGVANRHAGRTLSEHDLLERPTFAGHSRMRPRAGMVMPTRIDADSEVVQVAEQQPETQETPLAERPVITASVEVGPSLMATGSKTPPTAAAGNDPVIRTAEPIRLPAPEEEEAKPAVTAAMEIRDKLERLPAIEEVQPAALMRLPQVDSETEGANAPKRLPRVE